MLSNCSMPDAHNKAGDQANLGKYNGGEEYGIIKWYNKPWKGILRYSGDKQSDVRKTISNVAIAAAKNNHIGYSQTSRETYINQLRKVNYNPSSITKNCCADCSSSTAANVIAAGHLCGVSKLKQVSSGMSSSTAVFELKKAGFKYLTDSKYRTSEKHLVEGDILVGSGHLSIYVGNAKNSSVSNSASSSKPTIKFKPRFAKDGQPKHSGYYAGKNNFPINSSTGSNCTWYAYGRFCEIADKWVKVSGSGNAWTFYEKSRFPNCKRGKTPKLGAIACWGYGSAKGDPGHVAVVEEINKKGDVRITHGGWSGGWNCGFGNKDVWCKKSENYIIKGFAEKTVFRGFIYNPIEFDENGEASGAGSGNIAGEVDKGTSIDMSQRISTLYSSDNYQYISALNQATNSSTTKSAFQQLIDDINKKSSEKINESVVEEKEGNKTNKSFNNLVIDEALKAIIELINTTMKRLKNLTIKMVVNRQTNTVFNISRYLVEAPFIEIKIGNTIIGSYKGTVDNYPNYVTGLDVTKTNGIINQYNVQLVHQIRAGEDPNLLDKVFAKNQFNPITISYGDTDNRQKFNDIHAIITNINMNRDYASARITYNIQATSAGSFITAYITDFPAVTDKPSNVIRKLLYSSSLSSAFKEAFPGMASRTIVDSKGLIPTNDRVLNIEAKKNTDPITYLNYLVSCMSNAVDTSAKVLRKSSYFIFYKDDQKDGAQFEIREIQKTAASNSYNSVYEVTVGYPDENNIFSFNVSNDNAWAIMYDKNINAKSAQEYVYTIENNGDIKKYYSPNLDGGARQMGEREKNWWSFMVGFPVSATLTMRGLLRPAFLTNYIKINVVFYGQKHITSGLYTITEQKDTLNGSGFRTQFSLVRIGEN